MEEIGKLSDTICGENSDRIKSVADSKMGKDIYEFLLMKKMEKSFESTLHILFDKERDIDSILRKHKILYEVSEDKDRSNLRVNVEKIGSNNYKVYVNVKEGLRLSVQGTVTRVFLAQVVGEILSKHFEIPKPVDEFFPKAHSKRIKKYISRDLAEKIQKSIIETLHDYIVKRYEGSVILRSYEASLLVEALISKFNIPKSSIDDIVRRIQVKDIHD